MSSIISTRALADFRKIDGADAFLRIAKGVPVDIGVGKAVDTPPTSMVRSSASSSA